METIVYTKHCRTCNAEYCITDKDMEFYRKVSPVFNGERYLIPTPELCPSCRQQRRLSWRNERFLYRRTCDATGRNIISIYSPDKPHTVYSNEEWYSDRWNPLDFGMEFDFSRTFGEQFKQLQLGVPRIQNFVALNENSDYTNGSAYNKDCYLIFVSDHNDACSYCDNIYNCKDVFDSSDLNQCSRSYELIGCTGCHSSRYLLNCHDTRDSQFCYECRGCSSCFLCVGLTNRSYCIENRQYDKAEYLRLVSEMERQGSEKLFGMLLEKKSTVPHLYFSGSGNVNSTGDYIENCKDSENLFSCHNMADCKNITNGNDASDCQDGYVVVDKSALSYETVSLVSSTHCSFVHGGWTGNDNIYYCDSCVSSKNLFGCIGLRSMEYCILNRQYKKVEYDSLVPKIIEHMQKTGEWGEFFSNSMSPFCYNETAAQEYLPLTREQAIERGFSWSDYEMPKPDVTKIIPASKLPHISEIPDDITNWAIECERTGKPFRITKTELKFYRDSGLPIPRLHPEERHKRRLSLRNPKRLYDRACDHCGKALKSSYRSDRPEKVCCEECYVKSL